MSSRGTRTQHRATLGRMFEFLRRLFRWKSREEKELNLICRGDAAQMARLIAFEKERRPGLDDRAAIRAAIKRYRNDQR